MVTIPSMAFALAMWLAAPPPPRSPAPPAVPSPPAAVAEPALPPAPPEEPAEPIIVDNDNDVAIADSDEPVVIHAQARRARGFIGVQLLDLTPELRQHFGVSRDAGVMVARVDPDSAAAKAGVAVGDIITSADGDRIGSPGELARSVRRKKAGDTLRLDLSRDRGTRHVTVTVEERRGPDVEIGELGDLGRLRELGPEIRERVLRGWEDSRPMFERNREQLERKLDRMQKRLDELERKLSRLEH